MKTFKKVIKVVLIGAVIFMIVGIISAIALPAIYSDSVDQSYKGFAYSREVYVPDCIRTVEEDPNADKSYASKYCSCIYDQGIVEFGSAERFTEVNIKADRTGDVSELNSLINYCLAQARGNS